MPSIPTTEKRPFIPVPGVVQVEMIYTLFSQRCENVYHVRMSNGTTIPTAADIQSLLATFEAWEHNTGIGVRSSGVVLSLLRGRNLDVQAGVVVERTPSTAVTGTLTGGAFPGNVTAAVSWRTGLGGRSYRGRSYHIGLVGSQISGNQLDATARTNLVTAYTALLNNVNTTWASGLVVLSYAHNKFWRDAGVTTPILTVSIDPNLDSQRRRLTGRGQ